MVSLRLWLAMRLRAALSMAFWVMDVVDVFEAVVCLLVRQAGIRSIIVMMHDSVMMCFVVMVHIVFYISICTKIMNVCNYSKRISSGADICCNSKTNRKR